MRCASVLSAESSINQTLPMPRQLLSIGRVKGTDRGLVAGDDRERRLTPSAPNRVGISLAVNE